MIKPCTSEYMTADTSGIRMRKSWYPRIVAESYLGETKDGDIEEAPDAVTMIEGDLPWFNNTNDDQVVAVMVHRAPRSIVTTDPCTVVLHDAWSFQVGINPSAEYPSIAQDAFGGRLQCNKASTAADSLAYGRFFLDSDDSQTWVPVGIVPVGQALHFRYLCGVQTPGLWIEPTNTSDGPQPRYEAYARWARLQAWALPVGSS